MFHTYNRHVPQPRIITLTTDFGLSDSYVGQLKGAALAVDPKMRIVDLCHEVPPGDIRAGAYILETGFAVFPRGTVHLAVVDPGVGGRRRPIVVRTEEYRFVGPDNGVLSRALRRQPALGVYRIEAAHYQRESPSATFDGRDRFAPVAAWLARGAAVEHVGPEIDDMVLLPDPPLEPARGQATRVPVVHVDRFGSVVLDVTLETLKRVLGREPAGSLVRVKSASHETSRFLRTFVDSGDAEPFLLVNSAGYLEIAVRDGRADERLELRAGDSVELFLASG